MTRMHFTLLGEDGRARRGRLEFARGSVETPAFMPVGTYGTVKAMRPEDIEATGAEIILGNTFHLYLRPGLEAIEAHQGLHRFMHWQRPILTDSGGFQVFSLAKMRKITEEGARFRSPVDGAQVFLSPEESMRIQRVLGSDIAMSFDECTPYPATEAAARASMELSMRWASRGFVAYHASEPPGTLFGIVQGGVYANLRLASLEALENIGFAGLAVGGLAVGETEMERTRVLDELLPYMPPAKPRYLMGWVAPRISSRRCGAGSICSIASCRPGMLVMPTYLRAAVCSIFVMRCIRKIPIPSKATVLAIPVAISAAVTCATSTAAMKYSDRI